MKPPAAAALLLGCIMAFAGCAPAATRSPAQRAAFQRANPCPATQAHTGPCPGYVVDHIVPLCAGGADEPANMQWQTVAEGKAKDRLEAQECRSMR